MTALICVPRHSGLRQFLITDGTDSEASSPPGSPQVERSAAVVDANGENSKKRRTSLANLFRGPGGSELSKDVLNNITMFKRKQKKVGSSSSALLNANSFLSLFFLPLYRILEADGVKWNQCSLHEHEFLFSLCFFSV